jgi:hypothetical protein
VNDMTGEALRRSLHTQVRQLTPRADPEAVFARIERRAARHRRLLLCALVVGVLGASGAGFLWGRSQTDQRTAAPIAAQDGTPPAARSAESALEPADLESARAGVIEAFRDAYTGGTPQTVRNDAIQRGAELEPLSRRASARAELFGYTADQLAGTSIDVTDIRFIDATHAVVRFTLSIPGHGVTIADGVGYAVFSDGRWKVSLRTACDLLSVAGLGTTCPPR